MRATASIQKESVGDYVIGFHAVSKQNFGRIVCESKPQMHRLAPTFRSSIHCVVRPWASSSTVLARRFASSGEVLSGETSSDNVIEEEGVIDNIQPELIGEEGGETPRSYRQFMDTIGYQYRFATPRNWLGRNGVKPLVFSVSFALIQSLRLYSPSP